MQISAGSEPRTPSLDQHQLGEEARRVMENQRENFRNLFRQTPEMVCVLGGPEHVFEFVNPAHVRVLGFDATGQKVREAQPESVEVHGILDEVYRTGTTAFLHEIPVTVGPRLRYFNLTYAARRAVDGRVNGVMILGSEITEQIDAREAMKRAKEAADEANQAKSTFMAHLSHELRTPLGVIAGFCELLNEGGLSPEEHSDYLEKIAKNARGLARMVDEILDLSKVEAGKLEIELGEFALKPLMVEVLDLFTELARDKAIGLELSIDEGCPETLYSDAARVRQILINLVGNAIKFTSEGRVSISVSLGHKSASVPQLTIRVQDSGIGLSSEAAQQIFRPFVQAHANSKRRFGGSGLGLAISKRLAEALGGSLVLESSAEGKGCTFALRFPENLNPPAETSQAPSPADPKAELATQGDRAPLSREPQASWPQPLAGLHILLAEDTVDNQVLISRILRRSGAEVTLAQDGIEAVEHALRYKFDLVLMDLQMPRLDGLEATRTLRKAGFDRPIVALTAHAMREELSQTLSAGCSSHLTKPIDFRKLLQTIEVECKARTERSKALLQ